jgi:UDP-N-acetylglucosamine 2-epimerase (non-hydrolysing)
LGIPCVTLRFNTERPETLEVGANVLAGTDPNKIIEKTKFMLDQRNKGKNSFGDGKAAKRIINIIQRASNTPSRPSLKTRLTWN